jgi:hypothetical protein
VKQQIEEEVLAFQAEVSCLVGLVLVEEVGSHLHQVQTQEHLSDVLQGAQVAANQQHTLHHFGLQLIVAAVVAVLGDSAHDRHDLLQQPGSRVHEVVNGAVVVRDSIHDTKQNAGGL